ncbi:hypothetical protein [Thalassoglobus sp.]|uniref:hypothetical protein n=1 Tax=Thalassoglobus sp. TaxID=2795869 RepID=UPI003AA8F82D
MNVQRLLICTVAFALFIGSVTESQAARIEADPSKKYELTKNRGPWMVSVATFHTTDPKGVTKSGKSPEEAAHELILELRKKGMPAYVYIHDPDQERVTVTDRVGREEVRKNLRRVRTVLVLAGNYNDINDNLAQDSLKWIKKLNPKCLQQGVKFAPTKARPTPLSGAFLTINPMLSPDEISRSTSDPLLAKLNSGENYSLSENRGEYTLVVARFYGKQKVVGKDTSGITDFLKDNDLDNAGLASRELVAVLRGNFDKQNIYNNLDAYVWHDRHESIVTVGAFSSPNDPAIAKFKKMFGPRLETFPDGSTNYQPAYFGLEGFGKKKDEDRLWLFEPSLQLIRVPRLK